MPLYPPRNPISNARYRAANVRSSIHFADVTQSNGIVSTSDAPAKDPVQVMLVSGTSSPKLMHESTEDKVEYSLETA